MRKRQAGLELCLLSPDILAAWPDSMVMQVKGIGSCFARNRGQNNREGSNIHSREKVALLDV